MSLGMRSTEFWLALALSCAGLVVLALGALWARDSLVYSGTALAATSGLGYAHSRGRYKGRPYLPPAGKI